jgi:excisionase family DNA binding protein
MTLTTANAADGRTVGPKSQPAVDAALLDARGVGTLLGCSVRHIYRLVDSARMPSPLRLGALLRWSRAELEAWIGAGCPPLDRGKQIRAADR